jgi:hypothetical protein
MLGVVDETWSWNMTIDVQRTLIVEPHQVFIGDTVSVEGYGFDSEERMEIWFWSYNDYLSDWDIDFVGTPEYGFKWGETSFSDSYWWNVTSENNVNVTTDDRGFFSITFTVPHDHGGDHAVVAYERSSYNISDSDDSLSGWGIGGVTIKPRVFLIDGTTSMAVSQAPDYDLVFNALLDDGEMEDGYFVFDPADILADGATVEAGTLLFVWVQGLPTVDTYESGIWYFKGRSLQNNRFTLAYDNGFAFGGGTTAYWGEGFKGNSTGDTIIGFIATGYTGLHAISLYSRPGWPSALYDSDDRGKQSVPMAWTMFNIAGPSPDTQLLLDGQDELSAKGDEVISKMDELAATVSAELSAFASDMASMMDDVKQSIAAVVNDGVSQILSAVDAVKSDVATVKSDVSSVKSDVSSLSSDINDVSSDISSSADTLSGVAGELGNSITYMYVLLALVVITLVLELVILLRKRA